MKKMLKKFRLPIIIAAVVLVAALTVGIVFLVNKQNKIEQRSEALEELLTREGEYDKKSIVLYNTNTEAAKALAEKTGAKLRITENGKFATLTLPEDKTIVDIYSDDEFLSDISKMSADWQVSVSEINVDEELTADTAERLPTRPRYSGTITDSGYSSQSYLDYMNMSNIWDYTKGSGITVAVIDSGLDYTHPEFAGRISEYSYNASEDKIVKDYLLDENDPTSYDWSLIEDQPWAKGGHGTQITGVIAAAFNGDGIVGIAPQVNIIVIKAECDEQGNFKRTSDLVFGLYYAIERDVDVVNMSFGGGGLNPYRAALQLAVDSDIICVASAGNDSTAAPQFPAADPNCIGVGALAADSWDLADYSNFGENVDVVAPGTTLTTQMGGGYGYANGTSLSAPATTGAVALYLSRNRNTEYKDLQEVLFASCYDLGDLGEDFYYGYGAIDISALILEERGTITFDYLTDEIDNTEQVFIRNHTLQNIPIPERLYAIFDGWYYDDQMTEEYNWYEDKFSTDLTLYANWVNEDDGVPYTYVELDDGTIEIRSYTGHRRYLVMPTYIDGKVVSSIGERALKGQSNIRQITLPGQLVRIRREAFANCTNLVDINIPDTVTEIGSVAFSNGIRISAVSLGKNSALKTIGSKAFSGCAKLKTFYVPKTVTSLDGSAFFGCANITSYIVEAGNTGFFASNGIIFNSTYDTLVAYPAGVGGEYKIPSGIRRIGICAFGFAKISSVDLSNVNVIGENAFQSSRLESIVIPDSVTNVGESAFADALYLRTAQLGHGITRLEKRVFGGDILLTSITVPNTVTTIADSFEKSGLQTFAVESGSKLTALYGSFNDCGSLNSVTLPDSLIYIGIETFSKNSSLSSITLPRSLAYIGLYAFANDTRLSNVVFEEGCVLKTIQEYAFSGCNISTVDLPNKLETIGEFAFEYNPLVSVTIPASVNDFGAGAFAYCYSLTNISVEEENANYKDIDGVVFTKDEKTIIEYPIGRADTYYTVPVGTEEVWKYVFCGSKDLQYIYLPETLTNIREAAFYRVYNLRYMSIPKNVVQIGRLAFAEDGNIYSVSIPDDSKITRIGFETFAFCGLQSFRVPSNISTMAQYAFEGCNRLTSFTFAANSKLESISAYMFDGCDNLQSITFENGSKLTSIQAHGLEGMRKLRSIDFGNALITNIDNFAFRFCESLTSFNVPEGVTYLGRYAFYQCKKLAEVRLPSTLEYIGRYAFLQTNSANLYFTAETLPETLQEDWDYGAAGYYLGVTNVVDGETWKYAELSSGGIAILQYKGNDKKVDMTTLNLGGDIVNIGGKAFWWSEAESVVIPETVKIIQNEAFYHSSLKSITIPASVTFIGKKAFAYTPIETLTFGANSQLKTIEYYAFEGTEKLTSVNIPKSVETLGRAVFKNSGLTTLTFETNSKLKEIPKEAFAYTKITSLSIPDGVGIIWDNAFRQTEKLETVSFGNYPDLKIRSNAFYKSGLKSLSIPANVTYIGEYAFIALENLQSFTVDENNPYYKSVDGLLVSKDGRKLISVPAGRTGSLTVPEEIEVIGFGAFENSKLTTVNFRADANILSFGYRAFFGMKNIHEITIPASVVSIEYYAFAYCDNLEKVTFADGSRLTGVYEGAFCGDIRLSNIALPETIIEISDFAFYGCENITKIPVKEPKALKGIYSYAFAFTGISGEFTTPENLIDIGDHAFMGLVVTKITVPDTQQYDLVIGKGAFERCDSLEEISLPFIGASLDNAEKSWFGYIFGAGINVNAPVLEEVYDANRKFIPAKLEKITISEGQTIVGPGAFYGIENTGDLILPESISEVYQFAFENCKFSFDINSAVILKYGENITISTAESYYFSGSNVKKAVLADNVTAIGIYAFKNCTELVDITVPEGVTEFRDEAFSECTALKNIAIPYGVTNIGNYAFCNCSSLESIIIPDSVVSLSHSTFQDCMNLKTAVLSDNIEELDQNFQGCISLTYVKLPDNLKSIGTCTFYECISLDNITIPESVTRIGYAAFGYCQSFTEIVLPQGVTEIGDYAFAQCFNLKRFVIPGGVKTTGYCAFESCRALTDLTVCEGVQTISERSFYGCGLTDLILPNSVTYIGSSAFGYCGSLASAVIPKNIITIENGAFEACYGLRTIYNNSDLEITFDATAYGGVSAHAAVIVDKNGIKHYKNGNLIETEEGFLFELSDGKYRLTEYLGNEDTVTLPVSYNGLPYEIYCMQGAVNVIVPSGFTEIGDRAFSDCATLKSILLPSGITRIGDKAFYNCTNLAVIDIPASVTAIGTSAFENCGSLCSIEIPEGVGSIAENAFYGCGSLTLVTLPGSVTRIGSQAFGGCTELTGIYIPSNVSEIGVGAFAGCDKLTDVNVSENSPYFTVSDGILYDKEVTKIIAFLPDINPSVTVPDTVTTIGECAFAGCGKLTDIVLPEGLTEIGYGAFQGCENLKSISLPESLTVIGDEAFDGCCGLGSISVPASVSNIGVRAFNGCSSLTDLDISEGSQHYAVSDGIIYDKSLTEMIMYVPNMVKDVVIPDGVTSISGDGFHSCKELESIYLPDSVTNIGTFYNCTNLKSIRLPANLASVGMYTFYNCTSLESVVIPDGVTEIGACAFYECTGLKNVTLPDSVNNIGEWAFKECFSLESITLPLGITDIKGYTFDNCKNLKSIVIPDGVTEIGSNAFSGCSSITEITLPDSVDNIGETAFFGCSSLENITLPDGITDIKNNTFSACKKLRSIVIPGGVTEIGDSAFNGCESITDLALPDSLQHIGDNAFCNCASLKNVIIPDSVNYIGTSAFSGCGSLQSVSLPNGITSVRSRTFNGCASLKSISLPDGVTSVGTSAFSQCTSLVSVTLPESLQQIGSDAFWLCRGIVSVTVPKNVTFIAGSAFYGCDNLYFVKNESDLDIAPGEYTHGSIALKAVKVLNKDNTSQYINDGIEYVEDKDGFVFVNENGSYTLEYYVGGLDTVTLPTDIDGNSYRIFRLKGVRNVIVPDGITQIDEQAFYECKTLTGIELSDGVTYIGTFAFSGCDALTAINLPECVTTIWFEAFNNCVNLKTVTMYDNVTVIDSGAFKNCVSLEEITIPAGVITIKKEAFYGCSSLKKINTENNSVTKIGARAFYGTGYYLDRDNWDKGCLYLDKWLIGVDEDVEYFEICTDTAVIQQGLYDNCSRLKLTYNYCNGASNAETTVIWDKEIKSVKSILSGDYYYFTLPSTIKNCVIRSDSTVTSGNAFEGISGITIWVEADEKDCRWDENFPGWSNGNVVHYGEDWHYERFFDAESNLLLYKPSPNTAVVIRPVYRIESTPETDYDVKWDITGDGAEDALPATTVNDITAYPVITEKEHEYVITFIDSDNFVISRKKLPYGEKITAPDDPSKQGYEFLGFEGYTENMTVISDMTFTAEWSHVGGGHDYEFSRVPASCEYEGYDEYVCSICGDIRRENTVPPKGHEFGEWTVTEQPLCAQPGIKTRTCAVCGYDETQVILPLSHNFTAEVLKKPTCSETGMVRYTCDICGLQFSYNIEKTPHDYVYTKISKNIADVIRAQNENAFIRYEGDDAFCYECSICHYIMDEAEYMSSSGGATAASASPDCYHVNKTRVILSEALCSGDGIEAEICDDCGDVLELYRIPAGAHTYGEPEWIWNGYEAKAQFTCSVCGNAAAIDADIVRTEDKGIITYTAAAEFNGTTYTNKITEYIDYTVKFIDHNGDIISERTYHYGDTAVIPEDPVKPSDETYYYVFAGWNIEITTVTADTVYTAVFESKAHEWNEPTYVWTTDHTKVTAVRVSKNDAAISQTETADSTSVAVAPDCLNDGKITYTANFMNTAFETQIYEETLTALGHDLIRHEAKNPTCTDVGWDAYDTCSRCDYTTYVEKAALGHDLIHHDAKAPTCTEIGWDAYDTCSRCDYTTYSEIAALGHDLIHHDAKAPTCTEIGWNAYDTCSRCDYTTYTEIEALGHDLIHHDAKAPTCTEIGWDAYDTCSRCDYTTYVEKAALGHDLIHHDAKAPTCTEIGWEAYDTCSRCDYTTYVEKAALGHDLIHHDAKAPTCTEIGWDAYDTCSRCDYTTYVEKAALGHDLIHHDAKAPTCTEIGWDAYDTCSRCDYTTYSEIAALGHEYKAVVSPPKCTEKGFTTYTCSRCGDSYITDYTDAIGHKYDGPEWTWNVHEAEAEFTCSACDNVVTVDATVAKTEDKGIITYTATAVFNERSYTDVKTEYVEYTIKFVNYDGKTLSERTYHYGDNVTVPDDPVREEDNKYTYTFKGWDKEIVKVTADATYTATYDRIEKPLFIPGDINGDGEANNKDVVALFRYVSGSKDEVNEIALDVNGDGKINNKDVTMLFRYLNNSDVKISDKPYYPSESILMIAIIPDHTKVN